MRLVNLLTPFLVSLVLVTPSYATTITSVSPWSTETSDSYVFYKSDGSNNKKVFSTSVRHSAEGKQRLYFDFDYNFVLDINPSASIGDKYSAINLYLSSRRVSTPSSTVMIFNRQAIKMSGYAKTYTDTDNTYTSYTPETVAGHNYLINLFKKSTSPIEVEFQGDKIYLPVIGFTKVWNDYGGNAL